MKRHWAVWAPRYVDAKCKRKPKVVFTSGNLCTAFELNVAPRAARRSGCFPEFLTSQWNLPFCDATFKRRFEQIQV